MKKGVKWMVLVSLMANLMSVTTTGCAQNKGKDIVLDYPPSATKVELFDALKARHSSHDFQDRDLSIRELSAVLWAADGVNRENGKRTAPAPYGKNVVNIYVTMKQGIYLYKPEDNKLQFISDKPINDKIGKQGDIRKASHVLILIGKINELPFLVKKEDRIKMANAQAGCIAQNVYLAAGALHLGTRLVEGLNEGVVKSALDLKDNSIPLYIMPLGYPKE